MDVERTMEFILEQQAATAVSLARLTARHDAFAARVDKRRDAFAARVDKRLDAIAKLMQIGMKALARTDQHLKEIAVAHKELAAAQKRTEASLKSLIDSLRRGGNGHQR